MISDTQKIRPLIDRLQKIVGDYEKKKEEDYPKGIEEAFSLIGEVSSAVRVEEAIDRSVMWEESIEQAVKYVDLALQVIKVQADHRIGERERLILAHDIYNIGKVYQTHGDFDRAMEHY